MATQKEKTERALYGPGIVEVLFGAVLAFILGGVLAVALLIAKPTQVVKEMPKEPTKGTMYFIEGSRDPNKARGAQAKRQQFLRGESVSLNEEELNTLLSAAAPATPAPAPAAKAGDKKDAPPPAPAPSGLLTATAPNFKVLDDTIQVAVPCTLSVLGVSLPVNVVAIGKFEKSGDQFVFVPDDIYLGSLAGARVPALTKIIRGKVMDTQKVPADLAAAWKKISNITIANKAVTIAM